jgi:hypothetical protein
MENYEKTEIITNFDSIFICWRLIDRECRLESNEFMLIDEYLNADWILKNSLRFNIRSFYRVLYNIK